MGLKVAFGHSNLPWGSAHNTSHLITLPYVREILPCICLATDERNLTAMLRYGVYAGDDIGTLMRVDVQLSPVDKLDPRYYALKGKGGVPRRPSSLTSTQSFGTRWRMSWASGA